MRSGTRPATPVMTVPPYEWPQRMTSVRSPASNSATTSSMWVSSPVSAVHFAEALANTGEDRRMHRMARIDQQWRQPLPAPCPVPAAVNQYENGHYATTGMISSATHWVWS